MTKSLLRSRNPWWTLVAVSAGGMMVGLDGTALTIAGPDMARSVGASFGELQWIANAYLLALAGALFPAGRLADRMGPLVVFLAGVLGFGFVSVLVAVTSTTWLLVVLRAAQGLCGALLQPAALALLRGAFPRERLELALGLWGGASAAAIAGGPILAGVIVQHFGWPVVFLINAPIAVVTVALALCTVARSRVSGPPGRPTDLLRAPGVALGAVLTGLSFFSLFGLLFFLTLYLQNVRGFDPVGAAWWLLPVTATVVLSAPLGGVLVSRLGPRRPAVVGLVLICLGILGFLTLGPSTTWVELLPAALVLGAGTGVALIASTQIIVAGAPASMAGLASALQQVATQLGGVLGIMVLGAVLSWRVERVLVGGDHVDQAAQGLGPGAAAFVPGFHAAVVLAAVMIAVGALLALRVEDSVGTVSELAGPPADASDVDDERGHQQ